jgi:hypothetical protein
MSSGLGCAYLDASPRFSCSLNTIGNTVGAAAGLTSPVIVAYFIETFPSEWAWKLVFLLTAFMCGTHLIFVVYIKHTLSSLFMLIMYIFIYNMNSFSDRFGAVALISDL